MAGDFPNPLAMSPAACSQAELEEFMALVIEGGEVEARGLKNRVLSAETIAFLRDNTRLIGVAGLKHPSSQYRDRVATSSQFDLSAKEFPLELGWVFIIPDARGRRLSFPLCSTLVELAADRGVFATSEASKIGMHHTLRKLGFVEAGTAYKSSRGDYKLQLFVRNPARQSMEDKKQ